jgi:hypothetical protein
MQKYDSSFRARSKSKYVIEVNDNGDTINFDLTDPTLPSRLLSTYSALDELTTKFDQEIIKLSKREDKKLNVLASQNEKDIADATAKFFKETTLILDTFLGEGATKKIFGGEYWLNMFNDFFEFLMPELEKAGLKTEEMQKSLKEKYKLQDKSVLKYEK